MNLLIIKCFQRCHSGKRFGYMKVIKMQKMCSSLNACLSASFSHQPLFPLQELFSPAHEFGKHQHVCTKMTQGNFSLKKRTQLPDGHEYEIGAYNQPKIGGNIALTEVLVRSSVKSLCPQTGIPRLQSSQSRVYLESVKLISLHIF